MNFPSVSQFSIAKGTGGANPPEMYIPLWWWSGNSSNGFNGVGSGGTYFLQKGTTALSSTYNQSSVKFHTLNSSWLSNQKFALEVSISTNSGVTGYVALWDITSNSLVSASQTSSSATTYTVVRGSQFTLTPGHSYAVTAWNSSSGASYYTYITDASLIVFPS